MLSAPPPLPGSGTVNEVEAETNSFNKSSQTKCNDDIASLISDPGAYFFNNNKSTQDKALGRISAGSHSHLYGSETGASVNAFLYVPVGGTMVTPTTTIPGSKFLGSSREVFKHDDGKIEVVHNANYVLIQFAKLGKLKNVTLAIFHVDKFKLEKQADGRTRFGELGFSGDKNYGSGGSIDKGADGKSGGHSHIELFEGLRFNLSGKEISFGDICP